MTSLARPFGRLNHAGALTRLKAHQALYQAVDAVASGRASRESGGPERIAVPQGGAEVARVMRARFIDEHRVIVVEAADRFQSHRQDD